MIHIVYVLQNPEGFLYKGVTVDLEKRLRYHNSGLSVWTKKKGPWQLVYREEFDTKSAALKREKFLKSGRGREFLKAFFSSIDNIR